MKTLRAIIVDDENLARRGLSLRLQHIPQVEVIAECTNGAEALKAIAELDPDLVFLDIQMPGMDGFEVISHLQADTMPMIVFVTAFDEYAVDAFKVHAVDYVLKPIDEERLQEAVDRALAHREHQESAVSKESWCSWSWASPAPAPVQWRRWPSPATHRRNGPRKSR